MRGAAAIILLIVVLAATPRLLLAPRATALLFAMRQLGAVSGWRCVQSPTYVYDPNTDSADAALLAAAPETTVLGAEAGLVLDSVEVDLRDGSAVVSTHAAGPAGMGERLVYVLTPGRLETLTFEGTPLCQTRLSDWKIVSEHHLG